MTLLPEQMGFDEATIETDATTTGFTVMFTVLEVAGLPLMQLALDVR